MINQLFQSPFSNKVSSILTKKQKDAILYDIEITNFKRMKLLLIALLIVEILFIAFIDIPNLSDSGTNIAWTDKRYFILHSLLFLVASVGIIVIKILIKNDRGELKKIHRLIIPSLTIIMLILVSIINGLDQIKIGYTSSVFIANMLICCAVVLIRFPVNLLVYSVPFSTFIGGLIIFQKSPALLNSNIINGTIFFVAVIIISTIIYDSQFNQISKNILLEEANQKLNYMSNHDPLTNLSNRRYFKIHAKQKTKITNQYVEDTALVLMDIDHFKNINDKFGHPIGDIVLKEVSNVLLQNIKDTDLITRWGGEEFLILLLQASINEAYILANKIRIAIENKIIIIDEFKINITASFGVAQLKGNFSDSFDASYKLADKALYQAKKQGRNQVVIASFTKEE
jgi:diguanylate cyclase